MPRLPTLDWPRIEKEFVRSDQGQTVLEFAKENGVNFNTMRTEVTKRGWFQKRKDFHQMKVEKYLEKQAEKVSGEIAVLNESARKYLHECMLSGDDTKKQWATPLIMNFTQPKPAYTPPEEIEPPQVLDLAGRFEKSERGNGSLENEGEDF